MKELGIAVFTLLIIFGFIFIMIKVIKPNKDINKAEVVIKDGCEYFSCPSYSGYFVFTHKGNCSNPIHIYGVEKQESSANTLREQALSKLTKEEKEVLGIK